MILTTFGMIDANNAVMDYLKNKIKLQAKATAK
jgi:hypothetical protein